MCLLHILRVPTQYATLKHVNYYPIFKKLVSFKKFRTLAFQWEVLRYCSIKIVDFTAVFLKKWEKSRIFDVFFRFSQWHSKVFYSVRERCFLARTNFPFFNKLAYWLPTVAYPCEQSCYGGSLYLEAKSQYCKTFLLWGDIEH